MFMNLLFLFSDADFLSSSYFAGIIPLFTWLFTLDIYCSFFFFSWSAVFIWFSLATSHCLMENTREKFWRDDTHSISGMAKKMTFKHDLNGSSLLYFLFSTC